ncbi:MAG: hypothetical protein RL095_3677 [Verrucomicrobiota bacterium]|jgi:hypothetical protein
MDTSLLFSGFLFGCSGMGYFFYGKAQRAAVPLACGIALMAYPYFIDSLWQMYLIGVVLMIVPLFVKI